MNIAYLAFSLFLLLDSFGNIPLFLNLLKNVKQKNQNRVIIRELLIALFVILLFAFLGDIALDFLHIANDTIQIAGGIILFILCLRMIFPQTRNDPDQNGTSDDEEPFIVPLAIPLIAGPAVLAAVLIFAKQEPILDLLIAIFIAWGASLLVLLGAPVLQRLLGKKGVTAIERLMGLILILIAVQMFLTGISCFAERQISLCMKPH